MNTIKVHKAEGLGKGEVESVCLEISLPIQPTRIREDVAINRGYFAHDAWLVSSALTRSLPQATLDRLIGHLLEAQASDYLGAMVSGTGVEQAPEMLPHEEWLLIEKALDDRRKQISIIGRGGEKNERALLSAQTKLRGHARRFAIIHNAVGEPR